MLLSIFVASALLTSFGAIAAPQPLGAPIIKSFDYSGVTLEQGPLRRQSDEVRDFYLRIPNDDLLKGFRSRAGLPAPGNDLGGWYTDDLGTIFGQILAGLSRSYAGTGDINCKNKVDALISEWGKCIEADGYFYASHHPTSSHYIYDKMVGGLVDAMLYCGNRDASACLSRITDWAEKNLDRTRPYASNFTDIGISEWYTLSENLYRAYLATGEARYRDFAQVWEYSDYWNLYANQADMFGLRPDGQKTSTYHAYSHVNTLSGAGAAYRVTGEGHYLQTLIHAYDFLQRYQCFATGGYGPDEQLLPSDKLLVKLEATHHSFETQCGSWAAFKMSKYLITSTGDARYGDWIERLVINATSATPPMTPQGGVFYFSDYNTTGAWKQIQPVGWTCCAGNRLVAVSDYNDLVYFHDDNAVYVNLFTPSTLRWKQGKADAALSQETRFPESETVEFTVNIDKPTIFSLKLRTPGWLASPITATINGAPLEATSDQHGWTVIQRKWHDNDRLKVVLPMRFWASPLLPERRYPTAILRGPVVLTVRSTDTAIAQKIDLGHLEDALLPSVGEPLTYHLASEPSVLVRPYYACKERERYLMYLDPDAPRRIYYQDITFNGNWTDFGTFRYSNTIGESAECSFEGTGIRWMGESWTDGGQAAVTIDGQQVAIVNQYAPNNETQFEWRYEGLAAGKHTIKVTILPEKAAESVNHFIRLTAFEILGAKP